MGNIQTAPCGYGNTVILMNWDTVSIGKQYSAATKSRSFKTILYEKGGIK